MTKPVGTRWGGARLDQALRRLSPRRLFWGTIFLNLALMAVVAFTILAPRKARFSLRADTEILTVTLPPGGQGYAWGFLPLAPPAGEGRRVTTACDTPRINLSAGLTGPLTMTARKTHDTDLVVTLTRVDGMSLGQILCPKDPSKPADQSDEEFWKPVGSVGPKARFVWNAKTANAITLTFVGQTIVGAAPLEGSLERLILRSGTVYVEASSAPSRNGVVASQTTLFPGDQVEFLAPSSRPAIAYGLLRVGESGVLDVTTRATAVRASVLALGEASAGATSVAPTFWAKLQAQSEWAVLLALAALMLNMVTALRAYLENGVWPYQALSPDQLDPTTEHVTP